MHSNAQLFFCILTLKTYTVDTHLKRLLTRSDNICIHGAIRKCQHFSVEKKKKNALPNSFPTDRSKVVQLSQFFVCASVFHM